MDEHSVLGRTIREITSNLKERNTSASEITQSHIDQIKKVNGSLNAVVQMTETEALEQAENLDKSMANGKPIGALHGIPMTLKDSLDTKGIITTYGTEGKRNYVPNKDASIVARLKKSGAILVGKTNTPEFTLAADTDNLIYGRTSNPYNLGLSPG